MVAGAFGLGDAVGRVIIDPSGVSGGINQAKTDFSNSLRSMGDGLKGFGDQISAIGGSLTALTAPITAFGVAGVNVAADFDSAMAEISARTGLVGDDLEQIRDLSLQMGADTAFSAQQAADAFLQLLSSGQSAEEAIATLPAVLDAAAASGEDLGRTADTVTDIMAMFGLEVDQAGLVVDVLAQAAGASSADMASLGQGFANVGGVAKNFGLDVADTAAVLAIFAENGIKGAEAGTNLKSMLLNMTRPTEDVQGAWERLGTSFYDANGNARPLEEIMGDLDRALDALPVEEQNELMTTLGGSYGVVGLNALRGSISISTMRQRMNEQASATEVAQKRMATFNGRMDSLRGSVETLMIEALTPLMEDVLTPLVEKITEVVNSVTEWVNANPELASQIGQVVAVVVAIGPALMIAGKAISIVGGLLAALASPVMLIIGGIAALVLAFQTNFLGIRDLLQPIIDNFVDGFSWLFDYLGRIDEFSDLWTVFEDGTTALGEFFGRLLGLDVTDGSPIQVFFANLVTSIQTAATFISTVAQTAFDNFFGGLAAFWERIQPGLQALANWFLTEGLPTVVNFIQGVVVPAVKGFIQVISDIWNLAAPFLANLFNWFVNDALPTIVGFINETVIPNVQKFIDLLLGFWTSIQPGLNSFFLWVTADALPLVSDFFTNVLQPVIDLFISVLSTIWETVQPTLSSLFNWFMTDGLPFITDVLRGAMDNFITPFINLLKGIWEAVRPAFDTFKTNLSSWWNWIRDNIITPLMDKVQAAINFVNDLLTKLGLVQQNSGVQSTTNDTLPVFNPGSYNIPGFASGIDYIPKPMLAMVHTGEAVLTAEENRARMNGGGGGVTITGDIVLNVPIELLKDNPALAANAASFADSFMEQIRRSG